MKYILLLIVVLAGTVPGQSIAERVKKAPDSKEFEVRYDKFKDVTWLSTHVMFRYPKGKISTLQCDIFAKFKGDGSQGGAGYFALRFSPRAGFSGDLLRYHDLIFLFDGDRIDFGEGDYDSSYTSIGINRSVMFAITPEQLKLFAAADKVEIQLGTYEGEIEKGGQPRLKTLLALTKP